MDKRIGFIGCGNMGSAIIGGIIKSKLCKAELIFASDKNETFRKNLEEEYGIKTFDDNKEVVKNSDILILSVKPQIYKIVIDEIRDLVSNETIIVTIAAGISINKAEELFNKDVKLVRTMPNTPALVGEGMSAVCPNKNVTREELELVKTIFNSFGKCEELEEKYFDGFIGISGSLPAYVFMFIEALGDAGVKHGIPRDKAYRIASQAVLGSAKMALETGKHPAALKDMVCSPAGTTIDAVCALEENGFRYAIIDAVDACVKRSKEM